MKYLLISFTVLILATKVLSRIGTEPNIISVTYNECLPEKTLYTAGENGVADRSLLLREASALSYSVGK